MGSKNSQIEYNFCSSMPIVGYNINKCLNVFTITPIDWTMMDELDL